MLAGYEWALLMPLFLIGLFIKSGVWRMLLFFIPCLLLAHFWGEAIPRWIFFILALLSIFSAGLYMYWYSTKDPTKLARQRVIPTSNTPLNLDEKSYEIITGTPNTNRYSALLLRSFKDDGSIIGYSGSGQSTTYHSLEESLANGLKKNNINCVKLGLASRPDARGVTVITTTEDEWYNHALLLIKHCSVIFIIVNDTESLFKEIRYILDNNLIYKTYFIFNQWDIEEKWNKIEHLLSNKLGHLNLFPEKRNWYPVLLNISKSETKFWCVRITNFTSSADHNSIQNAVSSIKNIM